MSADEYPQDDGQEQASTTMDLTGILDDGEPLTTRPGEYFGVPRDDTPGTPAPQARTLAEIRADWQGRIDDARALETRHGGACWNRVHDIDRDELGRVLEGLTALLGDDVNRS
jgi:hypothetical protein